MATEKKTKSNKTWIFALIGCVVLVLVTAALLLRGCSLLHGNTQTVTAPPATEAIPVNERNAADFSVENDRVTYPGAVAGVDVSEHQGEIDWQRVADSGISFAILRLGYRGYGSGELYMDETFEQNLSGATAAGLDVGVYFFSQATSEQEAIEEAEYILDALDGATLACPVFFDWEEIAESERTQGMSLSVVSDAALAFCKRIEQDGYKAGVYFNQTYGYSLMRLHELRDYTFWLAEYKQSMSFYYDVAYWQYTGTGKVDGIATDVDLNLRFNAD